MGNVSTCLWFDGQAEEAARFYTSVVKNSRVLDVVPYGEAGPGEEGSVMIVTFELDGGGSSRVPSLLTGDAVTCVFLVDTLGEVGTRA